MKYTEQGEVQVTLTARQDEGRALFSVAVRDTGIGIPDDHIEHLFVPFSRVHDTKRLAGIEGTGLGLALTHEFVTALGGEVAVESEQGRGSVFTVELPGMLPPHSTWTESPADNPFLQHSDPEPITGVDGEQGQSLLSGWRVLVCEDSEPIATLVDTLLSAAGAEVTVCSNGREGVTCFAEMQRLGRLPTLVLMDMQMPIMDGYEAASRINARSPETCIVALTAFALSEDVTKCLRAGCDYYLTKPISAGRFARELRDIFDRYSGAAEGN